MDISREGKAAVYESNELYRVQAITVVSPLKRITSNRENNHDKKQNTSMSTTNKKSFSKVLSKASDELAQADTSYYAAGYTKDAKAFYTIYQTREYSFDSRS